MSRDDPIASSIVQQPDNGHGPNDSSNGDQSSEGQSGQDQSSAGAELDQAGVSLSSSDAQVFLSRARRRSSDLGDLLRGKLNKMGSAANLLRLSPMPDALDPLSQVSTNTAKEHTE